MLGSSIDENYRELSVKSQCVKFYKWWKCGGISKLAQRNRGNQYRATPENNPQNNN